MTTDVFKTITLGFISFVATNLDDFLLLLLLFSAGTIPARKIVLGQYLGMAGILILSSFAGSVGTLLFPPSWVGILGLFPLTLGFIKLYQRYYPRLAKNQSRDTSSIVTPDTIRLLAQQPSKVGTLAIAFMTLANGGDNIAVYSGIFSEKSNFHTFLLVLVFVFLTTAWCIGGYLLASHQKWKKFINYFNSTAIPYALIVIGFFILLKLI